MNVLFILCDTIVKDKLSPYHKNKGPYGHIQTPNIERLAKRSLRFNNYWINSAPCMPARRDLWTGRIEFPWRSWGPRETFDPDWSVAAHQSDTFSGLFTDHANLMEIGAGNYHHFFDHYEFVRGHFNDHCETILPVRPNRPGAPADIYRKRRSRWQDESESYVAQNLSNVAHWLDQNHQTKQPFFLFVDEFDPHWPLDPPEPYRSMYLEDPTLGKKDLTTSYHSPSSKDYSAEEIEWLNAQCAGKITMVDHHLGKIFDRLDAHDLWDDTMVILMSDHGEFIGEYEQMSKGSGFSYPLFANPPCIIHYPGSPLTGQATDALACAVDLHATVMDALGLAISPHSHGHSLLPLLEGESNTVRTDLLFGWWGKGFYWTDGHTLLCKAPEHPGPLYQYGTNLGEKWIGLNSTHFDRYTNAETGTFMPHTDQPVYRIPSDGKAYGSVEADFDALFDLDQDPECQTNLYAANQTLRNESLQNLIRTMKEHQVPAEHFERLGLKG
jgi:arylsulfatase A-like enzyme